MRPVAGARLSEWQRSVTIEVDDVARGGAHPMTQASIAGARSPLCSIPLRCSASLSRREPVVDSQARNAAKVGHVVRGQHKRILESGCRDQNVCIRNQLSTTV